MLIKDLELPKLFGTATPYMKLVDFSTLASALPNSVYDSLTVTVGAITYTFGTNVLGSNLNERVLGLARAINASSDSYSISHKVNVPNIQAWAIARGLILQVTGRIIDHNFTCSSSNEDVTITSYNLNPSA